MAQQLHLAALYWNCSVFELDGQDELIEQGFLAHTAEKEAENALLKLEMAKNNNG